jgi:hypothetical protein
MSELQKEMAFLRDLIGEDWTDHFTKIIDENLKFSDDETILYVNAGTGNHTLALSEKLGEYSEIFGYCEDEELLKIAEAKTAALQSEVQFSCHYPENKFDTVLADASFVRPQNVEKFIEEAISFSADKVAFFLPTAGSFGEVFSFLWEVLHEEHLLNDGNEVEKLISELPTISRVKEMAQNLGLENVKEIGKSEIVEFENGEEFINSPLLSQMFFPFWFDSLTETEKEQVTKKLAQKIDEEDGEMSFRFSIKATLFTGDKG